MTAVAPVKFGRTYQMTVTGRVAPLTGTALGQAPTSIHINYPTTLEFNVTHSQFASANHAEFALYNLKASSRSQIVFDAFWKAHAYPVTLNAGYVSQVPQVPVGPSALGTSGIPTNSSVLAQSLPQIFDGYANMAYTERSGDDLITRISALDNGDITGPFSPATITSGTSGYTAPVGATFKEIVLNLMGFLKNVKVDVTNSVNVSNPPSALSRPRPFVGNAWQYLIDLARPINAFVFIDNGTVYMVGQNDTIPGTVTSFDTIQASTGLIDVPRYTGDAVMCKIIFEPSVKIGQAINLKSTVLPALNGRYTIVAYTHHGVISGVVSGDAVTELTLVSPNLPYVLPS